MIQTILFFVAVSNPSQNCQAIERPSLSIKAPAWAFHMPTAQCVKNTGSADAVEFLKNVETVVTPFED